MARPLGETTRERRLVLGGHRDASHQRPTVLRWSVRVGEPVAAAHPAGWDGDADTFDGSGPAEDAGEEVKVVAERGPAAVWAGSTGGCYRLVMVAG